MPRPDLRDAVLRDLVLREPLISARAVASRTGASAESVSRLFERLVRQGVVTKVMRGLWANTAHSLFSPYLVIGHLQDTWHERAYVSFISALHLHGMISQIPREIHVATARARLDLETPVGHYVFHRLQPALLTGEEPGDTWDRFKRATPEKALFDTVYIGLHRGQQWRHLPELELPAQWKWKAWSPWIDAIEFRPFRRAMEQARERLAAAHLPPGRPPTARPPRRPSVRRPAT
jgi:DNA-binding transcriptional regulator YhcF (GntR family)